MTAVTGAEQYFLELINRARENPTAEAQREGIDLNEGLSAGTISSTPKQPLALNDNLQASIEAHLQDELTHNYFSHTGSDGSTPTSRITAAGYTGAFTYGENLAWSGTSAAGTLDLSEYVNDEYNNLFIDSTTGGRGHRVNMLNGDYQEEGSGVATGQYQGYNAVLTGNDFGARAGHQFVTGVAYTDAISANNFYDIGEGLGGDSVVAKNNSTGASFSTTTNNAGGYQIDLPAGTYTITFSGAGFTSPIAKTFAIGSLNVKVDANTRTDVSVSGPPVLAVTNPISYTENAAAAAIDSSITIGDSGRTNLASATITIGNFVTNQDVLGFTLNAATMGNIAVTSNANGVLTLASSGATATLLQWQTALRSVTYSNTSENPSTTTRSVSFAADDGAATNHVSNVLQTTVSVTAVNDAPGLSGIESTPLSYTAQGPGAAGPPTIVITSAVVVSDLDDSNLTGATVKFSSGYQSTGDGLSFTNTNNITGVFNQDLGILTLTGSDTLANYQAALRSVRFFNSSATPTAGTRTIAFQVNDGHTANNLSNAVSRNISVTSGTAPVLSGVSSDPMAYTENQAATAIAPAVVITDSNSPNMSGAAVQITGNFTTGQDRLAFVNVAGITGSFNSSTGILSFTGPASLSAYQTILRSVTYQNVSDNPNVNTRVVSLTVNDSNGNSSAAVTRFIRILAVNDPPVLSAIESSSLAYQAGTAPIPITSTLLLGDADSLTIAGATVTISRGFQISADVLKFTNTAKITGVYNTRTGVLTLTGADTGSNYRTALRSVTYSNPSASAVGGTRTFTFQAGDGSAANNLSNSVGRNINVTAGVPSVVAGVPAATLAYQENAAAAALAPTIAVTDADSTILTGATVKIIGNYSMGPDRLSAVSSGGVTATFDATTGTLSLAGRASPAAYQTVLRTVTFQNISDNPSTLVRTISFIVTDASANPSTTVTRTVTVTAVNDPPGLSGIEASNLSYVPPQAPVAISSTIVLTDPDDASILSVTIQIGTGFQKGADVLSFVNTSKIGGSYDVTTGILILTGSASGSDYRAAIRSVTFSNNSGNPALGTRVISIQANDGHTSSNLSNIVTRKIDVR